MNRLVYLFELDSVRNSETEIEIGQRALYREIVLNGNSVVLSFIQLTDSEVFLILLKEQESYKNVIRLFELGAIKISRFGKCRTASQYIQDSILKCKENSNNTFLFSGLPVYSTETELLQSIEDALHYNDVECLRELLQKAKMNYKNAENAEKEELEKECERLVFIIRYVKMLLLLSVEKLADNPPKQENKKNFTEFMDQILSFNYSTMKKQMSAMQDIEFVESLKKAIQVLKAARSRLKATKGSSRYIQNRSNWLPEIYRGGECQASYMANAIVDLCYNYTIEDSISNVSKHYDQSVKGAFSQIFIGELYRYWNNYQKGIHTFPTVDSKDSKRYIEVKIPWNTAVRIVEGVRGKVKEQDEESFDIQGKITEDVKEEKSELLYEYNFRKEKKEWNFKIAWIIIKRFLFAIVYIILFCVTQWIMNQLEGLVSDTHILDGFWYDVLFAIVLFGILGSVVSELTHLPDILESVKSIGVSALDCCRIWKESGKNRKQIKRG